MVAREGMETIPLLTQDSFMGEVVVPEARGRTLMEHGAQMEQVQAHLHLEGRVEEDLQGLEVIQIILMAALDRFMEAEVLVRAVRKGRQYTQEELVPVAI